MTQWAKYSSFRWLALVIREMIAASLWAFAFVKLWIYDVDIILIENYALYLTPLLHYRLFFIIAFIALSWLILGNKHFRVFIAYVLFYPFIIILWRLPKLAVKNLVTALVTAIVFAPAIEALIRAFKIRFIMVSLAILSGAAVVILSQPYLLMFFMTILLIYLFIHYIYRFRIAFHPSSIFSDLAAPMRDSWSDTLIRFKNRYLEEISRFDPESQEYRNQYMHSLGSVFLISIFFKFCEKKLREVVDSRKTDLYFLLALLYTFVLTVLVFAFEYHALYN
jgi:hypothetical protein